MRYPLVSVIILNYNGIKFINPCLKSVLQSDYPNIEIILVDNGSTDHSLNNIPKSKKLKIIKNRKNIGFCLANNQAADIAQGQYLYFLNYDASVYPDTLSQMVATFDQKTGITTSTIKDYNGTSIMHQGIGLDIFGYPTPKLPIFYAEGSSLMIPKKLFHQLHGFDKKYFMFHEDIDLSWRVWLSGYTVKCCPQAKINHFAGAASGGKIISNKYKSTYLRRYYSERNNIRTLLKNYSLLSLLFIFPIYLLINFFEIIFFIIILQPKFAYFYPKAYIWNIVNIKNTLDMRKQIQQKRQVSDLFILSKMSKTSSKLIMLLKVGIPNFQ